MSGRLSVTQTTEGRADSGSGGGVHHPGTPGHGHLAAPAGPDANSLAPDGVLAAEVAGVGGVLLDFDLLHLLTQRSTISGAVLPDDSYFLGTLSHCIAISERRRKKIEREREREREEMKKRSVCQENKSKRETKQFQMVVTNLCLFFLLRFLFLLFLCKKNQSINPKKKPPNYTAAFFQQHFSLTILDRSFGVGRQSL